MFYIYGLYDKMNESYIELVVCKSEIEIKGIIDGMVNYTDSVVSRFPKDFRFSKIGSFNSITHDWNIDCDNIYMELVQYVRRDENNGI